MSYVDAVEKTEVPHPAKYYTPPEFETVNGVRANGVVGSIISSQTEI